MGTTHAKSCKVYSSIRREEMTALVIARNSLGKSADYPTKQVGEVSRVF